MIHMFHCHSSIIRGRRILHSTASTSLPSQPPACMCRLPGMPVQAGVQAVMRHGEAGGREGGRLGGQVTPGMHVPQCKAVRVKRNMCEVRRERASPCPLLPPDLNILSSTSPMHVQCSVRCACLTAQAKARQAMGMQARRGGMSPRQAKACPAKARWVAAAA